MNKCRCDERLQTKTKEFTRLPYTGLVLELEHLKIETRLIIMMFVLKIETRLIIMMFVSQTSLLLTSSLSLGVPVPRPTQCMGGA
jgi:hypothetical protein